MFSKDKRPIRFLYHRLILLVRHLIYSALVSNKTINELDKESSLLDTET